jgi:hypothetical protein
MLNSLLGFIAGGSYLDAVSIREGTQTGSAARAVPYRIFLLPSSRAALAPGLVAPR